MCMPTSDTARYSLWGRPRSWPFDGTDHSDSHPSAARGSDRPSTRTRRTAQVRPMGTPAPMISASDDGSAGAQNCHVLTMA